MDVVTEFSTQLDSVGNEVNITWMEDDVIISIGIALVKELHRRKTVFDGNSIHTSDSIGNCRISSQAMALSSSLPLMYSQSSSLIFFLKLLSSSVTFPFSALLFSAKSLVMSKLIWIILKTLSELIVIEKTACVGHPKEQPS